MIGLRAAALALALAAVACGGETVGSRPERVDCRPIYPVSDSPDPGGGPVDCTALDGYEIYVFDTFEADASTAWYTNSDRTAMQEPVPDLQVPASYVLNGGRCIGAEAAPNGPTACASPTSPRGSCSEPLPLESRRAVHVRSGLLTGNGGQLGRDLAKTAPSGETCPFHPGPPEVGPCSVGMGPSEPQKGTHAIDDFSDWDGILLWARVAPGSAGYLRVRAADGTVDDKGCVCNPYTDQNDSSNGCDKWGTYITIDTTFRAYLLPFKSMQQGGWGLKSDGLDTSNLFSFGFEWGRGAWDLWIDDVGFYRRRP